MEQKLISADSETRTSAVVAVKKLAEKRKAAEKEAERLQTEAETQGMVSGRYLKS